MAKQFASGAERERFSPFVFHAGPRDLNVAQTVRSTPAHCMSVRYYKFVVPVH